MSKQKQGEGGRGGATGCISIDALGDDLVHNILQRLPASSAAAAACVSRSWSLICSRILSAPKLSSAFSLNPSLQGAVDEVFRKVLSEPIRPQFAIASIGPSFDLNEAHKLVCERFRSRIPVITALPQGIIGRNAVTDTFEEVQWEVTEDEDMDDDNNTAVQSRNRGILLTVGHLPGMNACLLPLYVNPAHGELLIDEFLMGIKEWTSSVSDSSSPASMILFSDCKTDMKPVLEKMVYAFPEETSIVGDDGAQFLFKGEGRQNPNGSANYHTAAVVLVFARDRNKPLGMGETGFHVMLSAGVSPIGPTYKAASVKERSHESSTWLTARRESLRENLDGQTILDHIYEEIGNRIQYPVFYIGVIKRRKCSVGKGKARWFTFQEFHEVLGGDEEYLFVSDVGIKTGDSFRFYISNSAAALSTSKRVTDDLRDLKQHFTQRRDHHSANAPSVFGGILFCCCGRGESFFGQPNVDSLPFLENFPEATFAGTFCAGEVGRGGLSYYDEESQTESMVNCFLHVYSSVYLLMSYNPPLV